jgi:hypothetical protein
VRLTKGYVVEVCTRQSQLAQLVTRSLRQAGWKERYVGKSANGQSLTFRDSTSADRREALLRAVEYARQLEQSAQATLAVLETYAKQEGAL